MEIKKVLVTGDKGYIGSTLVPMLLQKGYNVVGLDTQYFTHTLDFSKEQEVVYKAIKKDIREVTEKDLEGIDAIIHLAALSNDPMGALDGGITEDINYKASIRLAKLAKKIGIQRFLFSSSCSIYGIAENGIVDESSPVNPLTAYAKSKIATEKALQELSDDMFFVGLLRNSTVYGYAPNFRDDLVVNNFTACAVATKQIKILSDGTPWRPLIDVRDLSAIFIEFLSTTNNKLNGNVCNIGFQENNFQVKQVLTYVQEAVPGCKVIYTNEHGKDTRSYKVSFKKFHTIFPQIIQSWPLKKSIIDLVHHLTDAGFNQSDFSSHVYTRLAVLESLQQQNKLDEKFYWQR